MAYGLKASSCHPLKPVLKCKQVENNNLKNISKIKIHKERKKKPFLESEN